MIADLPKPEIWNLTAPRLKAPPGTVDSHIHFFGPEAIYPYMTDRKFTPADASEDEYTHVRDVLGIERAVLVQASSYGLDNSRQIDAASKLDIPTRLVLALEFDTHDDELDRLHDLGARGIRIATIQGGGVSIANIEYLAGRMAERGWNLEFLVTPDMLAQLHDRLRELPCNFVIGDMAGIRAGNPDHRTTFDRLHTLLDTGKLWIKLFGGYRFSFLPPPHEDILPDIRRLIDHCPERMLWGTDWPHVVLTGNAPDTTATLDNLLDWAPDDGVRKRILVDNPEQLYGFERTQ